ncbi:single-stranded-DNA-specific exonuclease RecJ [Thalassotalea profundi]|uniref:Single-stranded-DNA-specific exonuclease RecJ n=1 Tax=Thalassotalea profundi TaxID=2036687 RepID=A0ABQ3IK70_9GAMM|nr:single-stranded-DNA-specific exonuclease RecJ [Thalassotalea profundi]GHE87006.1 ssDNA exonuclease RecJ [Thalassotalea profundi]
MVTKTVVRRKKVCDEHLSGQLHPVIKQIYASRGVSSDQELTLATNLLAPVGSMKGLEKACQVLFHALKNQQSIFIIGDFDADGATSTALMMIALSLFGCKNHQFLVPNRFEYGYGLTPEIVNIAANQGAQLLITVDSGISCHAGVEQAKALGLKVIVTDHHLAGKTLPPADAIVNPNQPDCAFTSKSIAGVGVAFYLCLAMRKYLREQEWFNQQGINEPNIAQLLDLVALGTVADVVSLDANNRILVEQGLKRIRAGVTRPGIQALIEVAGKKQQQLVASDFGFALGPRINAAGRLDDMAFGINCLLADNLMNARLMAQELDGLNKTRREIEQGMQQEAESVLKALNFTEDTLPSAIALFHQDWHQGVIGIVAGRLKEKYHRPTIVFAQSENGLELKGSARSILGLHIRDLLEHIDSQKPELIIKFGGHAMAAGLSINKAHFNEFQQAFTHYASLWLNEELLQGTIMSDGELPSEAMTLSFAQLIRDSGPWGQNFPEPTFDDTFTLMQQRIVGEKHLKIVVEKEGQLYDGIAFNVDVSQWPNPQIQQVHLAYRLDINEFRDKQSLQLIVEHITVVN